MKRVLICILLVGSWGDTLAQTTGTCETGIGEAYLDIGNVRARILNNGNLFWRGSPAVYEVPKGGGEGAIFTGGFWVGGRVRDSLRIAAARYGKYEFWPGPLDGLGNPPQDCAPYDKVSRVDWRAIAAADAVADQPVESQYAHIRRFSPELEEWPHTWGAPVVDGDGDPTNYDVASGDRPELLGDQMLWWVMNDVGNAHRSTDSPPLGLQVSGSAFAFNTLGAVGNTTFYRYRLYYKGHAPLDSAYVATFLDTDLGNFDDDFIASDTVLNMAYTYNSDNDDEGHYGLAPPALGVTFLRSPLASPDGVDNDRDGTVDETGERVGPVAFTEFVSSGNPQGDPQTGIEYYNYMRARWKDGKPFTYGGDGRSFSNQPQPFMFPGDPVTGSFWSELNADGEGTPRVPAHRRYVYSVGPFDMEPGEVEEVVVAIVWSRGDSNLDSVRKLREDVAYIQTIAPLLLKPREPMPKTASEERPVLGYHRNYPNPFSDRTTIRYSLALPEQVTLTVYDMLGRKVATLVDEEQGAGWHEVIFEAEGLVPGTYVYRLQVGYARATEIMAVVR